MHVVQGTAGVFQDFKFVKPQPEWSAVRYGRLGMHAFCCFRYVLTSMTDRLWPDPPVQQHALVL